MPDSQGLDFKPGMRVGLFGGSFNPAHEGHVHVARTALERLKLDYVVWLVSPQNPLKSAHETQALRARLEGVRRLARDRRMIVSDYETRHGLTYTADTVRALKVEFPAVEFVWLMGSDNLAGFHHWKGWRAIARSLPIAVVARPGSLLAQRTSVFARRFAENRLRPRSAELLPSLRPPAWVYLDGERSEVSSTAIRSQSRAKAD